MPNQPAEGQVHLTLYLPKELRDRAKARAAAEGISLSAAVRRALEEYAREKL
jgi:predicted HicB family RNase H-like nuclease